MANNALKQRLDQLNQRVDKALEDALRDRIGLSVVAVTKRKPLKVVLDAYELGMRHFGENQIQEGIPKIKAAPDDITWHMIGHLQKNKVRKCVKYFPFIHSIDSLSLLQRVDDIAGQERVCPKIMLQVNFDLDPDKYGLHPDAVRPVLQTALALKHVECVGLMGIPAADSGPEQVGAYFEGMANMRDQLRDAFPAWPGMLSLGMSGDFEQAIMAGSNFIRVGSVLFGARD